MTMTYADVYRVIENRANFRLRLFADDHGRFPTGENARRIIETLRDVGCIWSKLDPAVADEITIAAEAVAAHSSETGQGDAMNAYTKYNTVTGTHLATRKRKVDGLKGYSEELYRSIEGELFIVRIKCTFVPVTARKARAWLDDTSGE